MVLARSSAVTAGVNYVFVVLLQELHNKVNIVPVIAKSDTLTKKELLRLKRRVMDEINADGIQTYDIPECEVCQVQRMSVSLSLSIYLSLYLSFYRRRRITR